MSKLRFPILPFPKYLFEAMTVISTEFRSSVPRITLAIRNASFCVGEQTRFSLIHFFGRVGWANLFDQKASVGTPSLALWYRQKLEKKCWWIRKNYIFKIENFPKKMWSEIHHPIKHTKTYQNIKWLQRLDPIENGLGVSRLFLAGGREDIVERYPPCWQCDK